MKRRTHSASEAQDTRDSCQKPPSNARVVMSQSMVQWFSLLEAAGVGAWGRTFQGWVALISWGTYGGANGVSTVKTHQSVSELTTCPRLGEDCWSRGLQSALLLGVLRWGISHWWLLPGLMAAASLQPGGSGNRDLHALPRRRIGSKLVGLGWSLAQAAYPWWPPMNPIKVAQASSADRGADGHGLPR